MSQLWLNNGICVRLLVLKGTDFLLQDIHLFPTRQLDFMMESAFAMLLHPAPRHSGSRRVSLQSCSPVDPAQYRARAARQRVSRQSGSPVDRDPAEYPPRVARQWIAPSIPLSIPCRLILPSIRPVSSRSGSPVFASGSRQYPAAAARQSGFVPPGAQLGLQFMLVPSCFECTLRLGKGDAFVLLWAVNKQLRLIPRRVSFWKGLDFC